MLGPYLPDNTVAAQLAPAKARLPNALVAGPNVGVPTSPTPWSVIQPLQPVSNPSATLGIHGGRSPVSTATSSTYQPASSMPGPLLVNRKATCTVFPA